MKDVEANLLRRMDERLEEQYLVHCLQCQNGQMLKVDYC